MSTEAVEAFIPAFFGEGNDLSLEALVGSNPDLAGWLEERLASLRAEPNGMHVLPRRHEGKTTWYGLAHSSRQLRELEHRLQSFLAPSYARVVTASLDTEDPVDSAVIQFTDRNALTVEVLSGQQLQVRRALELLSTLLDRRPHRQVSVSRPLGRLLREFEMAVLAGSEESSVQLLAEIEASGQLSAQNFVFLRIRRLVGLHRFDDVTRLAELATVLSIRRPAKVSAGLLESVYAVELAEFEAREDAAGALQHFSDVVLLRYPALFKSRHGIQTASAIKSFVLYSAAAHPEDTLGRLRLLESPDLSERERAFLESIVALVHQPVRAEKTFADAIEATRSGNFDGALEMARTLPPTLERAELLIRCATEIDSFEAMTAARDAMDQLNDVDREQIRTSKWYATPWASILRTLYSDESGVTPKTWLEWFRLATSPEPFENATALAERAVVEWTSEALTVADGRAIAQMLNQELSVAAARRIKDVVPHLLQFIDRVSDAAQHRELMDDLSTLLLLDEDLGVADVLVLVSLIGSLLEAGITAARCRQLIDDFSSLWLRINAPAHLDAAIELLDLLLTFGAPDAGSRDTVFNIVLGALQRWRRRVRPGQWALVEDLASELGVVSAVVGLEPSADAEDSVQRPNRAAFAGKTIVLYTLTEQAGIRARDFLLRSFDEVAVVVASDHVASDRLGQLARTADIFVIATRSAKHAATMFIEAQRPEGQPLLYAAGKGSASLLGSVFGCIGP
jgi:hypothetical protein